MHISNFVTATDRARVRPLRSRCCARCRLFHHLPLPNPSQRDSRRSKDGLEHRSYAPTTAALESCVSVLVLADYARCLGRRDYKPPQSHIRAYTSSVHISKVEPFMTPTDWPRPVRTATTARRGGTRCASESFEGGGRVCRPPCERRKSGCCESVNFLAHVLLHRASHAPITCLLLARLRSPAP